MADAQRSAWDPNIATKPLLAIEWGADVGVADIPLGWSRVTFWMQVRMKHRPQKQVWCRWLYLGNTNVDMAMASYPAQFTLDLSLQAPAEDVYDGGLDLRTEWSLAVSIAQVKKRTPSLRTCRGYWCISGAIGPKQRRVMSVSCEDQIQRHQHNILQIIKLFKTKRNPIVENPIDPTVDDKQHINIYGRIQSPYFSTACMTSTAR